MKNLPARKTWACGADILWSGFVGYFWISCEGNAKDYCTITTRKSENKSATCVVWKTILQKKNMRAFNVARPRQRNIYQITSPTCNLHAYRQPSELRLKSFFILTTLLSFEQLIHLDYFIWRRVGWWRDGFSVASWLVA